MAVRRLVSRNPGFVLQKICIGGAWKLLQGVPRERQTGRQMQSRPRRRPKTRSRCVSRRRRGAGTCAQHDPPASRRPGPAKGLDGGGGATGGADGGGSAGARKREVDDGKVVHGERAAEGERGSVVCARGRRPQSPCSCCMIPWSPARSAAPPWSSRAPCPVPIPVGAPSHP